MTDEQAIRELIERWQKATAQGDIETILSLMDADVVFLQPGQPPMRGRGSFAAAFTQALQHMRIRSTADIQEIAVSGDIAYCWNHLVVDVTPLNNGEPMRRSGHTLTVLRKQPAGNWVITRDANLLAREVH